MKSESNSSFLIGFVIGGLLGAAAALIYAPEPGRVARARVGTATPLDNDTSAEGHFGSPVYTEHVTQIEPKRIVLTNGTDNASHASADSSD